MKLKFWKRNDVGFIKIISREASFLAGYSAAYKVATESFLDLGKFQERERIIKLLADSFDWNDSVRVDRDELIALITGENA